MQFISQNRFSSQVTNTILFMPTRRVFGEGMEASSEPLLRNGLLFQSVA